ncbi:MAG: serine/threonine-protein phosphatase, partial [Gammaproteobacteria bacterium]
DPLPPGRDARPARLAVWTAHPAPPDARQVLARALAPLGARLRWRRVPAAPGAEGPGPEEAAGQGELLLLLAPAPADGPDPWAARLGASPAGAGGPPLLRLVPEAGPAALAACLEAGAQAALPWPVPARLLRAQVGALLTSCREAAARREELLRYREQVQREHAVARRVFRHVLHAQEAVPTGVRRWLRHATDFGGDVALVATTPEGGVRVLLADFTGHDLSAAVGAIPLSEVFRAMSAKGLPLEAVVAELDRKLAALLPTGLFCAAVLAEQRPGEGLLRLWNGGLPDALLWQPETGRVLRAFPSRNLPLGVRAGRRPRLEEAPAPAGSRLLLASDGVWEAADARGRMLGPGGLTALLRAYRKRAFDALVGELEARARAGGATDDMTLLELALA